MATSLNTLIDNKHNNKKSKYYGFTLIEILVVLFIGGLILNIASIAIDQNVQKNGQQLAQTLFAQMRLARQNAILLNQQYALSLKLNNDVLSYSWLLHNSQNEQWRPTAGNGLKRDTFPDVFNIDITIEDHDFTLAKDQQDDASGGVILFLSSGETTPFEIVFNDKETPENPPVILKSNHWGKLSLKKDYDS